MHRESRFSAAIMTATVTVAVMMAFLCGGTAIADVTAGTPEPTIQPQAPSVPEISAPPVRVEAPRTVPTAAYDPASGRSVVVMVTSKGTIRFFLYDEIARRTVNEFMQRVKTGAYDGLPIGRITPDGFVEAGGAANSSAGAAIPLEHKDGLDNLPGAVGLVRAGRRLSSMSQLYIVTGTEGRKDRDIDGATVFGQVIDGLDVARKLTSGDRVEQITILETRPAKLTRRYTPVIPEALRYSVARAVVQVVVHADGTSQCSIANSTGDSRLDDAILDAFTRCEWEPALRQNKPVESKMLVAFDLNVR